MVEQEAMTGLNIVLLPDRKVFNKALTYSYNITRRFSHEFVLDSERFRPHITLYQGHYPNRNIEKLISSLEEMKNPSKEVVVEMNDFQLSHDTFIFWNSKKTPELQNLHERILTIANPFREDNIPPITKELYPTLSDIEKRMVDTTGSILNKELFHPHITLTRLKHKEDGGDVLKSIGKGEEMSFVPYSIAVAHLGAHGTISDIVNEIPLN